MLLVFLVSASGLGARAADGDGAKTIGTWRVKNAGMKGEWKVDADYPVFDIPDIDNHVAAWLTAHVASLMDDAKDVADADVPETLFTVTITYEVIDAPPGAVNLLFQTTIDSNRAAHPATGWNSLTFSSKGRILFLDTLFAKPERALEIFARQAPKLVADYFKDRKDELEGLDDWIAQGTEAKAENYRCYTVERDGIRLHFQQYQVTPYSMGAPDILVPVAALAPAGPNPEVWPDQAK